MARDKQHGKGTPPPQESGDAEQGVGPGEGWDAAQARAGIAQDRARRGGSAGSESDSRSEAPGTGGQLRGSPAPTPAGAAVRNSIMPHGRQPSPRPAGYQSHHLEQQAALKKSVAGYDANADPTQLMPTTDHQATFDGQRQQRGEPGFKESLGTADKLAEGVEIATEAGMAEATAGELAMQHSGYLFSLTPIDAQARPAAGPEKPTAAERVGEYWEAAGVDPPAPEGPSPAEQVDEARWEVGGVEPAAGWERHGAREALAQARADGEVAGPPAETAAGPLLASETGPLQGPVAGEPGGGGAA